jgi:3-oxoacyl-[acyl-carrier protein] reductase
LNARLLPGNIRAPMNPRVILVTGANGGLGQAIARAFIAESENNFVWLAVRERRDAAEQVASENPARCRVIHLDVTQTSQWKSAIATITQETSRLDVLVNNAGHHEDSLLATMNESSWRNVMASNLDAVFHGCQAVLPTMISQRSGRIVNISSLSALLAPGGQTNYAAAKAGVLALTQSLAKEVARIGITVNAVCPGYIDTDALRGMNEDERKAAQARVPMRRFGKPSEVAAAVTFFASPEASYITGAALKIDGGIF